MNNSMKTALALGLITVIGAGGMAMVADAQDNRSMVASGNRIAQTLESQASEGSGCKEQDDDQEVARYRSLARITPQQAQQTAETAQGTAAIKVKLDVEDGSLVYEVNFTDAEVLVDAGNGQILKTELVGQEEEDATEVPVRGSIQVSGHDQD